MAEVLSIREKEMLVRRTFPEKLLLNLNMLLYPEKQAKELIKERVKACSSSPFVLEGKRDRKEQILELSKKEGIQIAVEMAERGELLVPYYESKEELLKKQPNLYFHIPQEMRTEEDGIALIQNSPRHAPSVGIENMSFEMKLEFAKTKESWSIPNGFLDNCSDEEVYELIDTNPDIIHLLPTERYTKEILYFYLERMVKRNLEPIICNWASSKVPEELKDKVDWRSLCMVSGYCYSLVPEEKRDEYITQKIFDYTLAHNEEYVHYVWMARFLPEKLKTEDNMLKLIEQHPHAAEYLPKNLQNDNFYDKARKANPKFVEHIDFTSINPETLEKCLSECDHLLMCDKKIPKNKWNLNIAMLMAKITKDFSKIPKEFQTREVAEAYLTVNCDMSVLPEPLIDKDLCLFGVRHNNWAAIRYVPEKYKTDEFYKICKDERLLYLEHMPIEYVDEDYVADMINMGRVYLVEQIPEKFRTEKIILLFAEKQTRERTIPMVYQTAENVKVLREHWKMETKGVESYFWSTIKPEFRDMEALDELSEIVENSISILLTKEQVEKNLAKWPENILFAPKWYLDKYVRNNEELVEETPEYAYNYLLNVPEEENTVFAVYRLLKGKLTKEVVDEMLEDVKTPLSNYSLFKGVAGNDGILETKTNCLEKYDPQIHSVKLVIVHTNSCNNTELGNVIQLEADTYFPELQKTGELECSVIKDYLKDTFIHEKSQDTKKENASSNIPDTTCFEQLTIWDLLSA